VNTAAVTDLFQQLDRELWLVTAKTGAACGGLIANCVVQASIAPEFPRVLVGLSHQHHTWTLVEGSGAFALHLLAEEHLDWVWHFGLQSGRDRDKLAGLSWRPGPSGSPVLAGVLGWLDCRVEARLDGGDRTFYLAEVLDGAMEGKRPLTMSRLLQQAPAERLQQLKDVRNRDAAADAELIRTWRQSWTTSKVGKP
jgi:flavin reductase (DIM6/NTAB) family NADH-FMN oxidoreductase RutF